MIAVDTSVVVRLLTGDDPGQAAAARSLFAANPIWISKTVLLETGWVLGSLYGFDEREVREALGKLLGLDNVQAEDRAALESALALAAQGIELADAIHLVSRPPGAAFATFDQPLIRRAARAGAPDVTGLPAPGRR